MQHDEDGPRLWIPDIHSTIRPYTSTLNTVNIPVFGSIYIPSLTNNYSLGDTNRLSDLWSGQTSISRFYERLLPDADSTIHHVIHRNRDKTAKQSTGESRKEFYDCEIRNHGDEPNARNTSIPRTSSAEQSTQNVNLQSFNQINILISQLESQGMGLIRDCKDEYTTTSKAQARYVAMLLRPYEHGREFQVNFLFGLRNWRRRRSIHASLLRITLTQRQYQESQDDNTNEASCSCAEYRQCGKCEHIKSVLGNQLNRMRIMSFSVRGVLPIGHEDTIDGWSCLLAINLPNEDVQLYNVFKRHDMSSTFPTSCTVIFDRRVSKANDSMAQRLSCVICPGKCGKRMQCTHESIVSKFISKSINETKTQHTIANASNMDDVYLETVMLDNDRNEIHSVDGTRENVSFASRHVRRVFACPTEESAIIDILKFASQITEKDNDVFVGVDQAVFCSNCKEDIRENSAVVTRIRATILHTLHHGTIPIHVMDFVCNQCGLFIPYDGYSDGVFSVNKKHLFRRELLDMWLWDICGSGGTFRDACASSTSKSCAATAMYHRIGTENLAHRQLSNEAFTMFLKTLNFQMTTTYSNSSLVQNVKKETMAAIGILTVWLWMEPILEFWVLYQNLSGIQNWWPRSRVFLTNNTLYTSRNQGRLSMRC